MVDPETGEAVGKENIGLGYEIGKGQYVDVEEQELEKIRIESTHTIDIDTFVPRSEVDDRYLDSPYYVAPTEKVGQEAFAVIRDAIKRKGMAALGRVALARREHVILLEPWKKGLLGIILRYPYEVRDDAAYFEDIPDLKVPEEMLELAEHIVENKAAHFDPTKFEDRFETALLALLKDKHAGRQVEPIEVPRPHTVVNLMKALKRSLEAEGKPAAAPKAERPATKKARGGRQSSGRSH
jgi:DNA end-binding protein Ku